MRLLKQWFNRDILEKCIKVIRYDRTELKLFRNNDLGKISVGHDKGYRWLSAMFSKRSRKNKAFHYVTSH